MKIIAIGLLLISLNIKVNISISINNYDLNLIKRKFIN